jgi:hypothetical protein
MKPFKAFLQDFLDARTAYRQLTKPWTIKKTISYVLSTSGLALLIMLLPSLLIINLLIFVAYMKVWIVYGALIGYGFIHLAYTFQTYYIKDYSNDLEFVKIRRLFKLYTYTYGVLWFGLVYTLYILFGGYIA